MDLKQKQALCKAIDEATNDMTKHIASGLGIGIIAMIVAVILLTAEGVLVTKEAFTQIGEKIGVVVFSVSILSAIISIWRNYRKEIGK